MKMTVLRRPGDEDEEKVETERKNRKRWRQSKKSRKVVPRAAVDFVRQLKISFPFLFGVIVTCC